jgi:hypothetical protein
MPKGVPFLLFGREIVQLAAEMHRSFAALRMTGLGD